jgi:hypothetical protein|tara:strand:+ start:350 stop:592 length:243 start_codon:yes stop_codon:yes gene_type:complete
MTKHISNTTTFKAKMVSLKSIMMNSSVIGKYKQSILNSVYSFILIPGISLLPNSMMGVVYIIALGYLFLGIAIISDIFME